MDKSARENRFGEVAEEAVRSKGLELVHVEMTSGSRIGRIFIDKPGGVNHDDCAEVSQEVSRVLDSEGLFPDSFVLEVSSPGLERGLYSLDDFRKFAGSEVRLKTRRAMDGQKNYRGRLVAVEDEDIVIDDRTAGVRRLPFREVAKANLEVDFEAELRRAGK